MKAVTYFTNEKTKERIIQINLTRISKKTGEFEDLMDVLVEEARKNENKKRLDTKRKNKL
jgi:hypothetical protein